MKPGCGIWRLNGQGAALIMTLSVIVLISVLILAFFSRAKFNRQISFSSVNQMKAELLADSAVNVIVGELENEIVAHSTITSDTAGTCSIYVPSASDKAAPEKIGISSPNDYGKATLIAVSANGKGIYTGGRALGSAVTIDQQSRNGRYFSSARWFGSSGPRLGENGTLPSWVYISQNGGIVTAPSTTAKPTESGYVMGRFAYTIYDLSGLFNANAAGYSLAAAATDAEHYAAFKSTQAYADLSVNALTSTLLENLVSWRDLADGTTSAAYETYLEKYGLPYGFLQTNSTHHAFLSRRDLIRYADPSGTSSAPSNPGLNSNVLPYFTQFSRSVNAPSWIPEDPNGVPGGLVYSDTNSHILAAYHDDGSTYSIAVQNGDRLIQSRFSLAKIAWLTSRGPSAKLSSSDDEYNQGGTELAIRACFGLYWNSTEERWDYVGSKDTTSTTPLSEIDDLATVAQEIENGRAYGPNFFEILRSGIKEDALGISSTQKTLLAGNPSTTAPTGGYALDASVDLHVLKIGSDIIDCADNNNYPTRIALRIASTDVEVAGVEDLPYFCCITVAPTRVITAGVSGNTGTLNQLDYIWAPLFFNPHAQSPKTSSRYPSEIKASFDSGSTLTYVSAGGWLVSAISLTLNKDLSSLPGITIPQSSFESFRSGLSPYYDTTTTDQCRLGNLVSYIDSSLTNVAAFDLFSFKNETTVLPRAVPVGASNTGGDKMTFSNVLLKLEYLTPNGNLKTYATFGGNEAMMDSVRGIGDGSYTLTFSSAYPPASSSTPASSLYNLNSAYYMALWDPRTSRLGPSVGHVRNLTSAVPLTTSGGMNDQLPGGRADKFSDYIAWGLMPQGGTSLLSGAAPNLSDLDKVYRPADGYLGAGANLYSSLSDMTRRPVILQRPFRNVAELGYVFRDQPWKTLNFFHNSSADAALLDLFSAYEEPPVTAARIHLDSAVGGSGKPLWASESLLSGAASDVSGSSTVGSSLSTAIATTLNSTAFSYASGYPEATTGYLQYLSSIPSFISETASANLNSVILKSQREEVGRALSASSQARTWNLLIDVVAQSGRFPATGTPSADQFVSEGERRYWVSIAIDRYTGKVVDRQVEPVFEQ